MNECDRMGIDIDHLRNMNKAERIAVTEHARRRLVERGITIGDIMRCIESGEIIKQYEDDRPLPSCLILGTTETGRAVHTVVSHDAEWIYLITAYYPDNNIWETDFRTKKGC